MQQENSTANENERCKNVEEDEDEGEFFLYFVNVNDQNC